MAISPAPSIEVESNLAPEETQELRVNATAKFFDMYTNRVYSDKVLAVIREYLSNAWDAHREAGKGDEPCEVQLPTPDDPTFRVRDFGPSMTVEVFTSVFMEMMKSTKDQSNLTNGQMGIGSKVGFAIVDAVVFVRHLGGWSTSYVMARSTSGVPVMSLLGESETGEPDGFEVIISVPSELIDQFQHKAEKLSFGFMGNGAQSLPEPEYQEILSGENWRIVNYDGFDRTYYVRQGCVLYPVPDDIFKEFHQPLAKHSDATLIIDIPLGTADPAPDRENLSFDIATTANVKRAVEEAFDNVNYTVTTLLEAEATWLQRCKFIRSLTWYNHGEQSFSTRVHVTGGSDWKAPEFYAPVSWETSKGHPPKLPKFASGNHPAAPSGVTPSGRSFSFRVEDISKVVFLVYRPRQIPRAKERAHVWLRQNYRSGWENTYVLHDPSSRQLERLVTLLGLSKGQIVPLASIPDPDPPTEGVTRKPTGLAGVYSVSTTWGGRNGNTEMFERVTEIPERYLWFSSPGKGLRDHFLVDGLGDDQPDQPHWHRKGVEHVPQLHLDTRLARLFRVLGLGPLPTILGFTETGQKRFKPDPKWEVNTYLRSLRGSHSHLVDEYDTLIGRKTLIDTLEELAVKHDCYTDGKYGYGMRYDRYIISREDIITKILGWESDVKLPSLNETLVARFFDRPGRAKPIYQAQDRARRIANHFPLLFSPAKEERTPDGITEAVSMYIDLYHPYPAR